MRTHRLTIEVDVPGERTLGVANDPYRWDWQAMVRSERNRPDVNVRVINDHDFAVLPDVEALNTEPLVRQFDPTDQDPT